MTRLRFGDVYGLGGALALYWPDEHPCHPDNTAGEWLILPMYGDPERAHTLPDGARYLGTIPGIHHTMEQPS